MAIEINGDTGISGVNGSATTPAIQGTDTNTGLSFGTDEVNIVTGGTTRATVDSNGRLLVGTSTDTNNIRLNQKFSVVREGAYGGASFVTYGGTATDSAAHLDIKRSRGSTDGTMTSVANNDMLGSFQFLGADGTNFVRAAQINCEVDGTPGTNDMPSRLVFGTTADGESTPTERMRIGSDGTLLNFSAGNGIVSGNSVAAGTSTELFLGIHSRTSTTGGGTTSFRVWTNGNVQNTNNSYTGISDIKLKENIVDAKSQWDDIKGLRVVNYNFKAETGAETFKQLGLIAQEVEQICPGLVGETTDRDEDGNDLGTVTKSVNYSVLYMKAVGALQEAMERIEQLETRLTALEGGTN